MINFTFRLKQIFLASCLIVGFVRISQTNERSEQTFRCGTPELADYDKTPPVPTRSRQQRTHVTYKIAVYYDDWFNYKFGHVAADIIKTLFRQVQIVYSLPTLKSQVTIVVTKIEHVDSGKVACDYNQYTDCLDLFCNWQNKTYPDRYRTNVYDVAMFLTTKNLNKAVGSGPNQKKHGVAFPKGACQSALTNSGNKSCALATVSGLHSSYVIAHELGHSIGAIDEATTPFGNRQSCEQGVMSYVGVDGYDGFRWSNCSNILITGFLQTRNADCLFTKPDNYLWDFKARENLFSPSEKYDYNKQCEVLFGPHFKRDDVNYFADINYFANKEDVTAKVVCRHIACSRDIIRMSAEGLHFLLEGTECTYNGRNGVCIKGTCVIR